MGTLDRANLALRKALLSDADLVCLTLREKLGDAADSDPTMKAAERLQRDATARVNLLLNQQNKRLV